MGERDAEKLMKPAPFEYHRPESLASAVAMLAELGDDAKILAGGQSLVAMMNLRLARPSALVDINDLAGLSYILPEAGALRIGALTRHAQVERYPGALDGFSVLPRAARWVGHYPIRSRGTFGGSIAHSDGSAEWCLLAAMLEAEMVAVGPAGERVIPASQFFHGFFMNALEPDELLVEVRFPKGRRHTSLQEFARRHGDFAIVAAAVGFDVEEGLCRDARVVVGGVAPQALRIPEVEKLLESAVPGSELFAEAGHAAAAAVSPPADIHGSSAYRKDLTAVLVTRALEDALTYDG